jgi:hypothetical protein
MGRAPVEERSDVEETLDGPDLVIGRGRAAPAPGVVEIAAHREVREEICVLEHETHPAPMRGNEDALAVVLPGQRADAYDAFCAL